MTVRGELSRECSKNRKFVPVQATSIRTLRDWPRFWGMTWVVEKSCSVLGARCMLALDYGGGWAVFKRVESHAEDGAPPAPGIADLVLSEGFL